MVTPADFAAFQQQLRQEVTDVMQQLRAEVNDRIGGSGGMLNSMNTALQNVSARPAETKPYRISDPIPRNWEGNNEKGEFRSFMSDLHLWMQAWSNQGEKMLAIVEGAEKLDNNASPTQNDSKQATEDSAANEMTERVRSMACNSEEIRSEEQVRQQLSICSVDQ